MATSAQTLAITEIVDNICSYSEGNELFALALTSKTVSVSALDMLWKNVQTLKDLFLIIPGCFVDDYGLVSTKTFLFLFFFQQEYSFCRPSQFNPSTGKGSSRWRPGFVAWE